MDEILNKKISEPLKKLLLIESNKIALCDSPIFSKNFNDFIIEQTAAEITELKCTPNEVIFFEGEQDDCSIFFIQEGSVEIYIDTFNNDNYLSNTLVLLKKGQSFGELSFFTG